jgi:hypothetical protein
MNPDASDGRYTRKIADQIAKAKRDCRFAPFVQVVVAAVIRLLGTDDRFVLARDILKPRDSVKAELLRWRPSFRPDYLESR